LAKGTLSAKVTIKVPAFSQKAKELVETNGGSIEKI